MELQQAMETRRSIRGYLARPVEKGQLEELIQAALLAPTWKNSETPRYYITLCGAESGTYEAVRAALPEFNANSTKNAGAYIVQTFVPNVSGFLPDGTPNNELGNGWGCYDAGLQAMNLLLKAHDLGLSTLVMGIRDADALQKALNIPETETVVSVIAVGYSDLSPDRKPRKALEEVAHFL